MKRRRLSMPSSQTCSVGESLPSRHQLRASQSVRAPPHHRFHQPTSMELQAGRWGQAPVPASPVSASPSSAASFLGQSLRYCVSRSQPCMVHERTTFLSSSHPFGPLAVSYRYQGPPHTSRRNMQLNDGTFNTPHKLETLKHPCIASRKATVPSCTRVIVSLSA